MTSESKTKYLWRKFVRLSTWRKNEGQKNLLYLQIYHIY